MRHFDLSLVGLKAVIFREDVRVRLDGETESRDYRRNEHANLPANVAELLIRSGRAVAA